jgi:hypothetical protein
MARIPIALSGPGLHAIRQVQDLGFAAQESARCGREVALACVQPAAGSLNDRLVMEYDLV